MANLLSEALNEKQERIARKVSSSDASNRTIKSLDEALKAAEQIRLELADRHHTDSTELMAEDRER